jgi:hypothetical protein
MSYILSVEGSLAAYNKTSAVVDGPASSLRPDQSPEEMAELMLAHNDYDHVVALRNMQYLLNHTTYRMSPEFRCKVQTAMRIISGGPL